MNENNTLTEWLTYLEKQHKTSIDLSLDRIEKIATELGLNQFKFPVVLVGGTNGKGSTVRFLESIYLAAGYRVAAYTSPHLLHFNERLRINNENVNDAVLIKAFTKIEAFRGKESLSFFEFTTLAAFYLCQECPLDILLLEVGLGGRLDAVNVVEPDLSIITSIALDHCQWLGATRDEIAREKAGIFRFGRPAICGDPHPPFSLFEKVREIGASFYCIERDFNFKCQENEWEWQSQFNIYAHLPLTQLKLQNAASALMAIELMQTQLPVAKTAVVQGLQMANLPGRFEESRKPVHCIFDVAHNPHSALYLAEQLKNITEGRLLLVFSMLNDKAIADTIYPLRDIAHRWYLAELNCYRATPITQLLKTFEEQEINNYVAFDSIETAMENAIKDCRSQDTIVVCGSFHTVALAKQFLGSNKNDGD